MYREVTRLFRFFSKRSRSTRIAEKVAVLLQGLLQARQSDERSFIVGDSLGRLVSSTAPGPEALAVISVMPPSLSGIANFTMRTFRRAPYPVDVFTHYEFAQHYLNALSDKRLERSPVRVFDLATLPIALQRNDYRSQLFALGNSAHNLPIVTALRLASSFPQRVPIDLLVHDPGLLHVTYLATEFERSSFEAEMASQYGLRLASDAEMMEMGAFGLRILTRGIAIRSIFVNSRAAMKIVESDLPDVPVHTLFHPVMSSSDNGQNGSRKNHSEFRIGTFGIPGPAKCTELVLNAFQKVRKHVPDSKLIIAGWHATRFAHKANIFEADNIEIHDTPSDEALKSIMDSVDLGVQLRDKNSGESSGMVAQLLACEKPVIVSRVGAFVEYGEAARTVDAACSAQELCDAILDERKLCGKRRPAIQAYAYAHTPKIFCERIAELIPSRNFS